MNDEERQSQSNADNGLSRRDLIKRAVAAGISIGAFGPSLARFGIGTACSGRIGRLGSQPYVG
jgi:hypothetical protein